MTSLYLCCEPGDRARHEALIRALKDMHYKLRMSPDGDPSDVEWERAMKREVRDCDQVVLILTENTGGSVALRDTLAYARRLHRRLAYYADDMPEARAQLTALGVGIGEVSRVDISENNTQGVKGLLRSRGHTLSRSTGNTPGKNQKSQWMLHVTDELVQRIPGGSFNQTEFLRIANHYLDSDNQFPPKQISNLFAYHRGLVFPIVQLIAYIQVFQRWIPYYSRDDAMRFLRLSGVDEADLNSDWLQRKLDNLFASNARLNLAFPDVSLSFYGRDSELDDLNEYLTLQDYKIVLLEGMPGIGKTELAKAAAARCMGSFDVIYWVEMRTPSPAATLIRQFINFLAPDRQGEPERSVFIELLNTYRCLIIFDQFEAVLDQTESYELYLSNFADYDGLLRDIAASRHRSALLMTSTHSPPNFNVDFLVRYYQRVQRYLVKGLDWQYARSLPESQEIVSTDDELKRLAEHFNGHPSAVKSAILKIHDGQYTSITDYLNEAPGEGEHVKASVDELERGEPLSLDVLYWLVIEREYRSLDRLRALMRETRPRLNGAIKRLAAAYLIESHPANRSAYRIRSDALDYMTERLIDRFVDAIRSQKMHPLMTHGLKLAGSSDYLREAQEHLLVRRVLHRLVEQVGRDHTVWLLKEMVTMLQQPQWKGMRGYAVANIVNLLHGLGEPLDGLDFSMGTFYEADLRNIPLQGVNARFAEFKDCLFIENFANCLCMSFDPNGQYAAIGTTDGRVHLWDVSSGAQRWATSPTHVWMSSITFTPDGRWVISGDYQGIIYVWDAETGLLVSEYEGQSDRARLQHLAIGGDNLLASVGGDGLIRLWQIDGEGLNQVWTGGPFDSPRSGWERLYAAAFHPDGQLLAVAGEQQQIYIVDIASRTVIDVLEGHEHTIWSLAFSPDGQYLASASEDYTVRLWDVQTRTLLYVLSGHSNTPFSLDFSSDSKRLASGGIDKTIHLWDVENGRLEKRLTGHRRWIRALAFRPGQRRGGLELASCGDDKTIRYWDVERGETIHSHQGLQLWARALAFNPDGSYLATSRESLFVSIRDTTRWEYQFILNYPFNSWVRALAFSPRDPVVAAAHENWIIVFDARTGEPIRSIPAYKDQEYVWSLDYSPDGAWLICAGGDEPKTVSFWDTTTWERYDILYPHSRWVWQARPSPDGGLVATCGDDHSIRLWSTATRELVQEIPNAHQHSIWMLAFSPDGRFLVSATHEPTDPAIVWDMSGERIGLLARVYSSHPRKVSAIAISRENLLAIGGGEGDIELWSLGDQPKMQAAYSAHDTTIHALAFLSEKSVVVSASSDHTVKVWDTETQSLAASLKHPRLYEGLNLAGARGLSEAQIQALQSFGAHL
jgi:WD40 repeat protein